MSLQVTIFKNGKWRQNCYLVANDDRDALIIDPGSDAAGIVELVEQNAWRVQAILNTHAHYDHIGAVAELMERYSVPFYLHGADAILLKRANLYRMVFEATVPVRIPNVTHDISALPSVFQVGPFAVSWLSTPGHTDGSVCFILQEFLFSGDTLMRGKTGRTDLPGGNRERLANSVRTLMELPPETVIFGGHGSRTTLQEELSNNLSASALSAK